MKSKQKVLGQEHPDTALSLNTLASLYYSMGAYDKALPLSQQALDINEKVLGREHPYTALTLNSLAVLYDYMGAYEKALPLSQRAMKILSDERNPEILWLIQTNLAYLFVNQKRFEEAVNHYEAALDTIEKLRSGLGKLEKKELKLSFIQNKLRVYDNFITLLKDLHAKHSDKGYDRKALEVFERRQARVFLESMGKSRARFFSGIPSELRTKEQSLIHQLDKARESLDEEYGKPIRERNAERLAQLQNNLEAAETVLSALEERFRVEYPRYYTLKHPLPAVLEELQQEFLHPNELLLIYHAAEEYTLLWAVGPEYFRLFTLPAGEAALTEKIEALRKGLTEKSSRDALWPDTRDKAAELYALLIPAELRPLLKAPRNLYIVPTGPLYLLPFELLITGGEKGRYLIEDLPVTYLSSMSLLKTLREEKSKPPARHPLLAFANPVYDEKSGEASDTLAAARLEAYQTAVRGNGFKNLPNTEAEVRRVAKLFNLPPEKALLLGEDATRAKVLDLNRQERLDDYRYLLFAVHGVLPEETDYLKQAALVFSHPEKDAFLSMADVFGLSLNADLVSLSACNTGLGERVRGEGIMGLTRAFMYAGTPAVNVSLWQVDDVSTVYLSVEFFKHLASGIGPAEALRAAKLYLLRGEREEKYRHPYFWAPFVLFGNGGTDALPVRAEKRPPAGKFTLAVHASPTDSKIRIMNIRPKYTPGIALAPGNYDILVTRPGYKEHRKWVKVTDADVSLEVVLVEQK
ncbi:MAG: CHAT domain-containing protein [Gammaproteobacteria bacterium]|nr:CHAT domain-containing protein [Gammaproteobacteria bacterium]